MKQTATRYHDFSYGHRVCGHENKCQHLHGHNGRVTFTCEATTGLDDVGRVIDFSVMKSALCDWLEEHWDHKMVLWNKDRVAIKLWNVDAAVEDDEVNGMVSASIVFVDFNPTAENMAAHLVEVVGPERLPKGIKLIKVKFEETRKCSATAYAN